MRHHIRTIPIIVCSIAGMALTLASCGEQETPEQRAQRVTDATYEAEYGERREEPPTTGGGSGERGGARTPDETREPGEARRVDRPVNDQPVIDQPSIMPYPDDWQQKRRERTIPGTAIGYTMVEIPSGKVSIEVDGVAREVEVGPFWVMTTELTWDMYDVFVFNLDEAGQHPEADAVSRPSKPYIPPDRGFGHAGYPALSMTTKAAEQFCVWLSAKTGRRYRLPTEAEWRHLALAGAEGPYHFGDASKIDEYAWTLANADEKTHAVAQKKPNAWGLFDVHGNVMEWARAIDGKSFVACGGSYEKDAGEATAFSTAVQDWQWNSSDPQMPKSQWWLADASWVGMRIICDDETAGETTGGTTTNESDAQGDE